MPSGDKVEKAVLTVPEAGAMLGLSRGSAYEAARRGQLPVLRIGGLLKVPKAAFERMLEEEAPRKTPEVK